MIDPKLLRQDLENVLNNLKQRGENLSKDEFIKLEEQRKELQIETENLQNARNNISKQIGQKKAKKEDCADLFSQAELNSGKLKENSAKLNALLAYQDEILARLPNLLDKSVPIGKSEEQNQLIRTWGEPKRFDFALKDHIALGEINNQLDFESAANMSGARFAVLKGKIAKLHRALAQFMLDVQTKDHGYSEVMVPLLVEDKALYRSGQLPKFSEDLFHLKGDRNLSLIPTAEVPLTNLFADQIIEEQDLPIKLTSHTQCFRSEAGSYGKDTRGMIRMHQFEKIELVQAVAPEKSFAALEEITNHAEVILQKLNLPYRVMSLCSGDIGFCAAKTYDLEVWLPSQNCYREISSCSNTTDFQARRLKARFRAKGAKKPELLHLLNGSGLAVGRTLVAVMENYQTKDGDIEIPEVLRGYM